MRFPEFTDEWKKIRLSDNCNIVMGQSPSSKNYTKNSNDTILIQGNADLENGKIKPRLYTTEITKKSEKGDIILTVRAPVGDLAINEYSACIGRGVCSIKSKNNIFIYYILENLKRKHIWERLSQGSTFESINSNDIENISFYNPSENEQNKISIFLSLIDRKIDLLEKKKIQFLDFKRYCSNLIFNNQQDKTNKNKLSTLIKLQGGYNFSSKKFSEKGNKIIRIGDINNYINIENFNGKFTTEKCDNKYKVTKGDIIIALSGDMGKSGKIYGSGEAYINQRTAKIICLNAYSEYIYQLINSRLFIKYITRLSTSSAQANISNKDILNFKYSFHDKKEQKKIGDFLVNIDEKILRIDNKIKIFKNFKKGLLQKMFI